VLARVLAGAVLGIDAYLVTIEADVASGLPAFNVVGLPQGAVKEGRERVVACMQNSGFYVPPKRITVDLTPAWRIEVEVGAEPDGWISRWNGKNGLALNCETVYHVARESQVPRSFSFCSSTHIRYRSTQDHPGSVCATPRARRGKPARDHNGMLFVAAFGDVRRRVPVDAARMRRIGSKLGPCDGRPPTRLTPYAGFRGSTSIHGFWREVACGGSAARRPLEIRVGN
jgi:hypothetical protein